MFIAQIILASGNLADKLAYIDPSTGGMLFQILAAAFALFSGFIFFFSRQIKAFFARMRRKMRGEAEEVIETETEDKPESGNQPSQE
jgi:hypothetical protein